MATMDCGGTATLLITTRLKCRLGENWAAYRQKILEASSA